MNYPRGVLEWNGKALIAMGFSYPGNKVGLFTAENAGIAPEFLEPYGLQCASEPTTGGLGTVPVTQGVTVTATPLSVISEALTIGAVETSNVIFREATSMSTGGAPE